MRGVGREGGRGGGGGERRGRGDEGTRGRGGKGGSGEGTKGREEEGCKRGSGMDRRGGGEDKLREPALVTNNNRQGLQLSFRCGRSSTINSILVLVVVLPVRKLYSLHTGTSCRYRYITWWTTRYNTGCVPISWVLTLVVPAAARAYRSRHVGRSQQPQASSPPLPRLPELDDIRASREDSHVASPRSDKLRTLRLFYFALESNFKTNLN